MEDMNKNIENIRNTIKELFNDELNRIVLSNKENKDVKYNKIIFLLKIVNEDEFYYQIEKYTDKQVFHENIKYGEIVHKVVEYFTNNYKQIDAFSSEYCYNIKVSKKGKIFTSKSRNVQQLPQNVSHNKEKNYILKEGMIIEPLIDLGIFTKEGKVVKSKYDKYKQINRFVEIIDDEIKKNNYEELTILDFGCGKSYLTFIIYYYFVHIKNIKVKIIGLDLKEDVIKKCNLTAEKYGYSDLNFEVGDINGFKYNNNVDMVITLHACNTATDYALYNAIKWNAKMIFSVPCCQHEFNEQMDAEKFKILTRYGIVKERVAALMTDSVRANLLECVGYKTQLLEFIDIDHSPKNILIRACKGNVSKDKKDKLLFEVDELIKNFNLQPTLYKLLRDDNKI